MAGAPEVEFNRDIRPIFSDKCYTCHGPGVANRQTKLRFDTESAAKQDLGGHFAIVPGDLEKSVIIRRITAANPTESAACGGGAIWSSKPSTSTCRLTGSRSKRSRVICYPTPRSIRKS